MDKPLATPTPTAQKETFTITEVGQLLEGIADTLNALDARVEKVENAVDDVKTDTEEILNNLDNISFKADYPGLEE